MPDDDPLPPGATEITDEPLPEGATEITAAPASPSHNPLSNYVKGAWNQLNPAPAVGAVVGAFGNPQEAIKQDLQRLAQPNSMQAHDNMVHSWQQGDYANAARHAVGWLIPYVGEDIDKLGDLAGSGHLAEALGGATALGLSTALSARAAMPKPQRLVPPAAEAPPEAPSGYSVSSTTPKADVFYPEKPPAGPAPSLAAAPTRAQRLSAGLGKYRELADYLGWVPGMHALPAVMSGAKRLADFAAKHWGWAEGGSVLDRPLTREEILRSLH